MAKASRGLRALLVPGNQRGIIVFVFLDRRDRIRVGLIVCDRVAQRRIDSAAKADHEEKCDQNTGLERSVCQHHLALPPLLMRADKVGVNSRVYLAPGRDATLGRAAGPLPHTVLAHC